MVKSNLINLVYVKKSNKLKTLLIMALATLTLTLTGCFRMNQNQQKVSSASPDSNTPAPVSPHQDNNQTTDSGNTDFPVTPGKPTAQVTNFRGVMRTFESLTGITSPTAAVTMAKNDLTTYSLDSSPTSITGPMSLNMCKLSSEYCLSLVNKEKGLAATARKFFKDINFTVAPGTQFNSTPIDNATNALSRSFCGHDATDTIKSNVKSELSTALGTTVQDTTDGAVIVCSAFLCSSCAISNN